MNATSRMMEPPVREGMMGAPPLVRRGPAADRDAALVERLRRHEEGAAEALVAEYGNRAYRLAMRITNNSSDAEEVVQDALWAASRKIETFRGTAAFGSWVYRITANAAYQKRRARRHDRNETSWEGLASTIDELPGEHRATFLLHDVEGLSNPEIAETLQIKTATVKSRVHRARLFLRGRLAVYLGGTPELT